MGGHQCGGVTTWLAQCTSHAPGISRLLPSNPLKLLTGWFQELKRGVTAERMSSSPGWGWAVSESGRSALATGSPCPKPRPHHHLPSWGLVFFTGRRGSSLPTPSPHCTVMWG